MDISGGKYARDAGFLGSRLKGDVTCFIKIDLTLEHPSIWSVANSIKNARNLDLIDFLSFQVFFYHFYS